MSFQIVWRVRHSLLFLGLIELSVNEPAAMGLILAMSKEHYESSCGTLAALAAGVQESTLAALLAGITGIKRNSKEGRLFKERAHSILKEMVGEGHLAGRIPPSYRRESENGVGVDLIVVDLAPIEYQSFAVDCREMADDVPVATASLMRALYNEAEALLSPAEKLAAALSDDEPVNHDRSQ